MVNRTTLWRHLYPICCIYDLSRSNMLFAFFFFFLDLAGFLFRCQLIKPSSVGEPF